MTIVLDLVDYRSRRCWRNQEWKEYIEEFYKTYLNELDNYDDVVTHPEPVILECEVKWALGSTAVNKANGCDGIPVELFKTPKDDAIKVLYSVCQQVWKTQQWPQNSKRSIFIPVPKKGSTKEYSNHWPIALISYAIKVMLKILQASLQHYVNRELPDVRAGFRRRKETKDQFANIGWIIEKARESQKKISTSVSLSMLKSLTVWIIANCGKLLEMEIPDHLMCFLRNLYADQKATVRTGHGTTDWFHIGKGVRQGCILSPYLFNLYADHIMQNARLDGLQDGIKIAGRNIFNLRYPDDTTLMTESKEELESLS